MPSYPDIAVSMRKTSEPRSTGFVAMAQIYRPRDGAPTAARSDQALLGPPP
jgi:hypothetical protein